MSPFDGGGHAWSLVGLDYGGPAHLLDDQASGGDRPVAGGRVALTGVEQGKAELTLAMYRRLLARWRFVRTLGAAN